MARTVNEVEYAVKRNEILDVAQRLVYTRGYEQIAIRDILDELQISKGAFYHYFDSKQALLEALIERSRQEGEQILSAILNDQDLSALEKLQGFFEKIGRWKSARKDYLLALLHIWYADENALVRQKTQTSMVQHVAPLMTRIIQQGIREGTLTTRFPEYSGTIVMSMLLGLGEGFIPLLASTEPLELVLERAEQMVTAYDDALERVLGAPAGSLTVIDRETIRTWFV